MVDEAEKGVTTKITRPLIQSLDVGVDIIKQANDRVESKPNTFTHCLLVFSSHLK